MADAYRVVITARALAELGEVANYIRESSAQNAAALAGRIAGGIDSLSFMPRRYKRVGHSRTRRTPIHAMVVWPYVIYYRVDGPAHAVFVLTVMHGARRQPERFE